MGTLGGILEFCPTEMGLPFGGPHADRMKKTGRWKEREGGDMKQHRQYVEAKPRLGNPGEGPRVERDQLPFFLMQFQFSVRP